MVKFTAFVLLAISVTCCTVHKRVHRKGWYVEWRKPIKKSNSNLHSEESKAVNKNTANLPSSSKEIAVERLNDGDHVENETTVDSSLQSDDLSQSIVYSKISDLSKSTNKAQKETLNSSTSDPEDEKLINENKTMISVVMIVGAVVLAAFMIFLMLNIAGFQSALIATIGIVVLGIGSLLFLSIGLFLLIRQAIEKRHPEKKAKRQARIDEKESDPNYDPNGLNILLGVVILSLVTILFGFIIAQ